jgi:hypothetical protein
MRNSLPQGIWRDQRILQLVAKSHHQFHVDRRFEPGLERLIMIARQLPAQRPGNAGHALPVCKTANADTIPFRVCCRSSKTKCARSRPDLDHERAKGVAQSPVAGSRLLVERTAQALIEH